MNNKPTISIIIPAYNEEKNIESAVKNTLRAIESFYNKFSDYEIFIFDDCSKDKTGEIADKLALANNKIKIIHNEKNRGLAYNYKKGVEMANNDYISFIPGDDETEPKTIFEIFDSIGKADIIIPYTVNQKVRPLIRQIVSYSFTLTMNLLFGMRLKYFNGPAIHKKEIIKSISIKADNFAFQAEALIKLIKRGHSFYQVPMYIKRREYGKSSALKIKNILGVLKTIWSLYKEIYFQKNGKTDIRQPQN